MFIEQFIYRFNAAVKMIPHSLIALLARFSIAAIFWQSAQTKVSGFVIDIVGGEWQLGWPHLADSAITLFTEEYRLPLIPPVLGAYMAAFGEHTFSLLILFGLATRFSALALLGMVAVIQIFVYPGAYATHGVWAVTLLYLLVHGGGLVSVDTLIERLWKGRTKN